VTSKVELVSRDFEGRGSEGRGSEGGKKPDLVILHGLLGSSRNWTVVGRQLAERFRVRAVDLRNHGDSPHAATATLEEMTGDVVAWADAAGLERACWMGHSLGGKIVMRLACRRPERVDLPFVLDIAPRAYPPGSEALDAMARVDLAGLRSRRDGDRRLAERISDPTMRAFLLTNLIQDADGSFRWRVGLDGLRASVGSIRGAPLERGDRFDRPALFLVGERSDYFGPDDRELVRSHFPSARIEGLPGAGHNVHFDAREAFVAAIFRFVDRFEA